LRLKSQPWSQDDDEEEEMAEEESGEEVEPPPKRRMLLGDDNDDEDKDMGEAKSSFEVRTAKLRKEIKKMEAEAVREEKPWQMVGEVTASARPENSLLQEHLDYDQVAKRAPIVTEEVSKRLEDIIVQRIKDKESIL
jgi:U3 small nucleolar RNA-associated protein MPP10